MARHSLQNQTNWSRHANNSKLDCNHQIFIQDIYHDVELFCLRMGGQEQPSNVESWCAPHAGV